MLSILTYTQYLSYRKELYALPVLILQILGHTVNLFFRKLDILPIANLFQYCILVFMYKYNNNLLPYIFKEFFIKNYQIQKSVL